MERLATSADTAYISALAKRNYECIGFIPEPRIRAYIASDQVLLAEENGWPCGFLVFGNGWPVLKIYQACIQYDARRREHGFALVRVLIQRAISRSYGSISLWCADGLESNEFWRSAGFIFAGTRFNDNRRGRKHNRWVLPLESGQGTLWTPLEFMTPAEVQAPTGKGPQSNPSQP